MSDRRLQTVRFIGVRLAVAGACVIGVGCRSSGGGARARLESPDPADRARAIVELANHHDEGAVPALIDRLDDEDEAVRFFAILALERLTGSRHGYDYAADAGHRRAAVERWRVRSGGDGGAEASGF
ncbi:MAG: HEAT repeat domain-containing protein [bacterium]|nr:HEAT repeat domain-containing protein [bacterium]